ncbi:hypothetical protein BEWA_020170 [Theileria equi strain WA]|uniref:Uncharacterized protein n=1 Tax=Theileria equi strain WA TaxID=1537102 RepID=L0AVW5_THEEQ|nr:hypothetical protein BEWA_020170 [Theileria equi strain WA]AFZ79171.1 hypothetical protein BEWA_020170 [Theileria equi strain WA]|eukprot:XP_004828837.1 hypothetical protein BEWA_020170 [Theileria equi strain WA]
MYVQQPHEFWYAPNVDQRSKRRWNMQSKDTKSPDSGTFTFGKVDGYNKFAGTAPPNPRLKLSENCQVLQKGNIIHEKNKIVKILGPYKKLLDDGHLDGMSRVQQNHTISTPESDIDSEATIDTQSESFSPTHSRGNEIKNPAISRMREIETMKLKAKQLRKALFIANDYVKTLENRAEKVEPSIIIPRGKIELEKSHEKRRMRHDETFWELSMKELCAGLGALGLAACKIISFTGKSILYTCNVVSDKFDKTNVSSKSSGKGYTCKNSDDIMIYRQSGGEYTNGSNEIKQSIECKPSNKQKLRKYNRITRKHNGHLDPQEFVNAYIQDTVGHDEIESMSDENLCNLQIEYGSEFDNFIHDSSSLEHSSEYDSSSRLQDYKELYHQFPRQQDVKQNYMRHNVDIGNIDIHANKILEQKETTCGGLSTGNINKQCGTTGKMTPPILNATRPGVSGYGTQDPPIPTPIGPTGEDIHSMENNTGNSNKLATVQNSRSYSENDKIGVFLNTPTTIVDKAAAESIVKHTNQVTSDTGSLESQWETEKSGSEANTFHCDGNKIPGEKDAEPEECENDKSEENNDTAKKEKKKISFFGKGWTNRRKTKN